MLSSFKYNTGVFACFAQTFAPFAVKSKFLIIFHIFLTINPHSTLCQSEKISTTILSIAEQLASHEENPEVAESYTDRLYELAESPVRINSGSENEIARLFFINDFQVKSLVEYIKSSGKIMSFFELANIPGFDIATAEMIMPFCTLESANKANKGPAGVSCRLITNLVFKPGENDTSLSGSPLKALTKFRFSSGGFSGGFTAEKDPGEKLANPLPDFISAYLSYSGTGILRNITVGDYSIRFGQGTNTNSSFRPALSLTSPGYMSAREEIKQYTSSDENNFFRGISADFAIRDLGVIVFYSSNKTDATISPGPDSSSKHIENFYLTGTHTTPSLLLKKDAITETTFGMNVSYSFRNIKTGVSFSQGRLSLPFYPTGSSPEEVFDFRGKSNTVASLYYSSLLRRFLLFGEFSFSDFSNHAVVQGFSFRPSDRLTINLLYRNYDAGYFAFHGNGPGTGSSTSNETGLFGNFNFEAAKHLFISGGCDVEKYRWLKYLCSSPTWGMRHEVRIRAEPTEKVKFELAYYKRMSMSDIGGSNAIPKQEELTTSSFKGVARYSQNENFSLAFRIDYRNTKPTESKGVLMLQDINYKFRKIPLTIWFRYCIFNTDSWDSRIYTYENDLLYSFSIPAFSGEGSRSYIMAKCDIGKRTEVRLKYGITSVNYSKPEYRETDEIRFQLRVWL
jgi:hypothetical protein